MHVLEACQISIILDAFEDVTHILSLGACLNGAAVYLFSIYIFIDPHWGSINILSYFSVLKTSPYDFMPVRTHWPLIPSNALILTCLCHVLCLRCFYMFYRNTNHFRRTTSLLTSQFASPFMIGRVISLLCSLCPSYFCAVTQVNPRRGRINPIILPFEAELGLVAQLHAPQDVL